MSAGSGPEATKGPVDSPDSPAAPSAAFQHLASAPFVEFPKFAKTVVDKIAVAAPGDLFNGRKLDDQVGIIVTLFDRLEPNDYEKNETISMLTEFIKNHVNQAHFKYLATFWPPILPTGEHDFVFFFLLKLVNKSKRPENILHWISRYLFPKYFTKDVPWEATAFCRCKKDGKPGFWALLLEDSNFKILKFKGNEEEVVFTTKPEEIVKSADGSAVEVHVGGKTVASFTPEDPEQVKLWDSIMAQKRPILDFFTSFATPAIDQCYSTSYNQVANADVRVIRALLGMKSFAPTTENGKKILQSLFTVLSYGSKVTSFLEGVLLNEIDNCNTHTLLGGPSHTKNLSGIIINQYSPQYITSFVTKLAKFIDDSGGFGLGSDNVDIPNAEILISSIIKLVVHSYCLVPNQIKTLLSIIRSYYVLRSNNVAIAYQCVSHLFLVDFLVPALRNIKKHVPTVAHPEVFGPISDILKLVFTLTPIAGEFPHLQNLDNRIQRHYHKKLLDFAIAVSTPDVGVTTPLYTQPKADPLCRALENIVQSISLNYAEFQTALSALDESAGPSILGTNFAAVLCSNYVYSTDDGGSLELYQPPAPASPKPASHMPASPLKGPSLLSNLGSTTLPMLSQKMDSMLHKVVPVVRGENGLDPNKKYYKKVIVPVQRE